ncbi:hypothetical protein LOK82_11785 [Xylella fastidiosa subsp. multiplex]|uniref:Uncharacterized protein n=1 Tax=Xylella fastidiosa subsp. multiplex TaxID=644357 RepID=A0AAW6HX91_XYLFS|nr:hypothetical protein [Xylella fastidiosa]MCH7233986.1 hypothetical protein [Xylella fastidiosa subsp. multiplex]MDC6409258.1 hypothetical protein [Xylella fastidiosa subsp. multiplex]
MSGRTSVISKVAIHPHSLNLAAFVQLFSLLETSSCNRQTVYAGAIPLETDLLNTNRNALVGLGKLAAAMLGTSTLVNGLACVPTAPATLHVQVLAGEIYSLQNLDGTAFGFLPWRIAAVLIGIAAMIGIGAACSYKAEHAHYAPQQMRRYRRSP